jgi:2,3-bisphosphoglycerate-dependent phosphoglycerate mutase
VTPDAGSDPAPRSFSQQRFEAPPGATQLLLVRHGQSQAYRDGTLFPLVDGHGDPPLSPLGVAQAELVGARLADLGVDAIYATTLRRTVQTATPLAERLGLQVRVETDLREVFLGEWEGGVFRQMMADGGPVAQQVRAEERWDAIPGAETNEALARRVRAAVERIAAAHPDERVAAFTHGGVISQALALASRSRPFAFLGADNTSISQLVITDGFWLVRGFNDTAHLEAAQLPTGARE